MDIGKLIVINFGSGNLNIGFDSITLRIEDDNKSYKKELPTKLPQKPEIVRDYSKWLDQCFPAPTMSCNKASQAFSTTLNNWLKSEPFYSDWNRLLSYCTHEDKIRVIFQTELWDLQQIPWQFWDFFQIYRKTEMALSLPEYESIKSVLNEKIRILAIIGDSTGINLEPDIELIKQLPNVEEPKILCQRPRSEISAQIWQQNWDILFFAGHSKTEQGTGRIYINDNEFLSMEELQEGLRNAIERGLKLAIFNSCDGLGLGRSLAALNLPQAIVMRQPVADKLAQEFLKHFLTAFSHNGQTLYLAVKEAKNRLREELGKEFPCANWLPVIYQNPAIIPPTWEELRGIEAERQGITINPLTTIQELTATEQEVKILENLESTNPEIFKDAAKKKLQHRLEKLFLIKETLILDKSYITCAEYQLFIDEKQKIGENYQPDHWESYRFLSGNSIKPIVGVRASDAEEFCQWLNGQYSQPGQKYRLPLQYEVEKYPVKQQIGCWCTTEKNYEIIGIEPKQLQNFQQQILQLIKSDRTPENYNHYLHLALITLGIDYRQSSQLANDINLKGITEIALQHEPNLNHLISSELPLKITLSQSISDEFDLKLSSANEIARICRINLNDDLKHIPDFNLRYILEKIAPKIDEALLQEIKRECKREISEFKIDFNARRTCYYLLFVYAFWQILSAIYKEAYQDSDFIKLLTRWRKSEKRLSDEYAKLRDKAFNLYILFLLLYERRKGNIPAWEGIRIVREKIE